MEEVHEEKSYSKFEWFFYMIFVPALFASVLGGVLLTLLGVDVVGKALDFGNSIPYVKEYVPGGQDADSATSSDPEQDSVAKMEAELAKSKQEVTKAKEELEKKEAAVAAMQKQITDLQKLMEEKKTTEEERQSQYQDLAKVYLSMPAKSASAIIENLSQEEAVNVLAKMKADKRAEILAKMDPKKAADLSILVKDTTINEDADIAALQKRIQILTKALSDTRQATSSIDNLAKTFSSMSAQDSSTILTTLMKTNSKRAISILSGMADNKRGEVLAEISKADPALAARITNELLR